MISKATNQKSSAKHSFDLIAKALAYLEEHKKQQPSLSEVARLLKVSDFHLQRLFTTWAGISPKKFLQYVSLEHAKELLKNKGVSVFAASYKTGLSSESRLHDLFVSIEGMTPGEYKNEGKDLTIKYSFGDSLVGAYLVASTPKGICSIFFFDNALMAEKELRAMWPNATLINKKDPYHEAVRIFLKTRLTGLRKKPQATKVFTVASSDNIKLHLKGTAFQLKVWEALLKIPEGSLVSYTAVSEAVEKKSAQRAVGTAIGRNPVAFIIPCHRVIKSVGNIGEYHWGTARKTALIAIESLRNATNLK